VRWIEKKKTQEQQTGSEEAFNMSDEEVWPCVFPFAFGDFAR
jgi:hypothetical protein